MVKMPGGDWARLSQVQPGDGPHTAWDPEAGKWPPGPDDLSYLYVDLIRINVNEIWPLKANKSRLDRGIPRQVFIFSEGADVWVWDAQRWEALCLGRNREKNEKRDSIAKWEALMDKEK
ncbi:hypothetical protein DdX_19187 [Ditylenchus destructor]|uniref:Uncharacterized protein n=1 Tax=Ditylenchus destructor TaxID=166010 RepID=A0AAD4QSF1_9BILA|nr:hypothetical protein DdX_19187 [Ditylenchus destructor]